MSGGVWKPIKIGGGGYVTGIESSADGSTIVCRTDTHGAYIWEAGDSTWRQLVRYSSFKNVTFYPDTYRGVYEICVAPNRPSRLCMAFQGDNWLSDDWGRTWTKLGLNWAATSEQYANATPRFFGQKMAIDPNNANVIYFGTPGSGVYYSFDAGTNWTLISTGTIPAGGSYAGSAAGHAIAFDPSSALVNGKTSHIIISSYTNGVYETTDAGATWNDITSGGPTTVRHAKFAGDGIFYCAATAATASSLFKWGSSTWTNISPGTRACESVCCDPFDDARIIAMYDNGSPRVSTDRGATWGNYLDQDLEITRTSDIPWLAETREQFMSPSDMMFDPAVEDKLWFVSGIGAWYTTFTGDPSSIEWTCVSRGIENLTSNCCVAPPGGVPLAFSWDRPVFKIDDPDTYPVWHGPYPKFSDADVDTVNNKIYIANHGFVENTKFCFGRFNAGTLPAPFEQFRDYYIKVVDTDYFQVSSTSGGAALDITTTGSGTHVINYSSIRMAWHGDWATSDPTYFMYVAAYDTSLALKGYAYSTSDGGDNWTPVASYPGDGAGVTYSGIDGPGSSDKTGGCVACSTPLNSIWVPSNHSQPYYTLDGGATWTEILIDSTPRWIAADFTNGSPVVTVADTSDFLVNDTFSAVSGVIASGKINSIDSATQLTLNVNASSTTSSYLPFLTGWGAAYYSKHICVAADRVTANKFYLFNYLRQGVYKSSDGGATWSAKLNTGNIDTLANTSAKFMAVPDNAGHLLLAPGKVGVPGDSNPAGSKLWRSTDEGATWVDVGTIGSVTIREPYAVGCGAAAPGETYPSVAFVGWLGGVYGIWRSDDEFQTWENIGPAPYGWVDIPAYIDGSKDEYGLWYLTFGGSSFAYRNEAMQYGSLL